MIYCVGGVNGGESGLQYVMDWATSAISQTQALLQLNSMLSTAHLEKFVRVIRDLPNFLSLLRK